VGLSPKIRKLGFQKLGPPKKTCTQSEKERDAGGIINLKEVIKDIYCIMRIKRREKKNCKVKEREPM
jgi:hypothetical protein